MASDRPNFIMQRLIFPNSVRSVRGINRGEVLRCVEQWPGISRKEITKKVGLTEAAVSRISRELVDHGLVGEEPDPDPGDGPGRRHIKLQIQPNGGYVFALCLVVSDKSLTLLNLAGDPVCSSRIADETVSNFSKLVRTVTHLAKKFRKESGVPANRILGMATVIAGSVNHVTGKVNRCSLEALSGKPLGSALHKTLGIPVHVETLGNALNTAHMRVQRKGSSRPTTLLIHVAMGMGASWIIDGVSYRGEHDERAIARIPLWQAAMNKQNAEPDSLLSTATGYAVLCNLKGIKPKSLGDSFATRFDAEELTAAISNANRGDSAIASVFQKAGTALGRQIFSISASLPPDQIFLAGPVSQVASYQKGVSEAMNRSFERRGMNPPLLSISPVGFLRATELFALEEFLYHSPLNLKRLLAN
jgi:predicted NBD/HSP70 family sugar kinase